MKLTINNRTVRWIVLPLLLAVLAGCGGKAVENGGGSTGGETPTGESKLDPKAAEEVQTKEEKPAALPQSYVDEKTGLTVKTPYGWTAAPYEGALVALISPSAGEDDIFLENVLITHDDQFKNLSMAAYLRALAYDVRQRYPDTETVESGEIEIDGIMGHWMIDTFTGSKGPSKVYRVVLIQEPAAYVFHGTALAATFDRYKPIFEAIATSMAWPEPEEQK